MHDGLRSSSERCDEIFSLELLRAELKKGTDAPDSIQQGRVSRIVSTLLAYDFGARQEITNARETVLHFALTIRTSANDEKGILLKNTKDAFERLDRTSCGLERFVRRATDTFKAQTLESLQIAGPISADFESRRDELYIQLEEKLEIGKEMIDKRKDIEESIRVGCELLQSSIEDIARASKILQEAEDRHTAILHVIQESHEDHTDGDYCHTVLREASEAYEVQQREFEAISERIKREQIYYISQLEQAFARLEDYDTKKGYNHLEAEVRWILQRISALEDEAHQLENEIGLQGTALVKYLERLRQLSPGGLQDVAMLYPLVSVLREIRALTQTGIRLMESADEHTAHVGLSQLKERVEFLFTVAEML